jgi:hypothetical protein
MPLITSAYGYILSIPFFASLLGIEFAAESSNRAARSAPAAIAGRLAYLMLENS